MGKEKVRNVKSRRLRRIYFTSHPVNSKKLPPEYKAFAAIQEDTANENKFNSGVDDLGGLGGLGGLSGLGNMGSLGNLGNLWFKLKAQNYNLIIEII